MGLTGHLLEFGHSEAIYSYISFIICLLPQQSFQDRFILQGKLIHLSPLFIFCPWWSYSKQISLTAVYRVQGRVYSCIHLSILKLWKIIDLIPLFVYLRSRKSAHFLSLVCTALMFPVNFLIFINSPQSHINSLGVVKSLPGSFNFSKSMGGSGKGWFAWAKFHEPNLFQLKFL